MKAGVRVCLATDGICSLDRSDRLSPLDDARVLWKQGSVDAQTLLAMLSVHGLAAMGLAIEKALLQPGAKNGLIGFEVTNPHLGFRSVLDHDVSPQWIVPPVDSVIA